MAAQKICARAENGSWPYRLTTGLLLFFVQAGLLLCTASFLPFPIFINDNSRAGWLPLEV